VLVQVESSAEFDVETDGRFVAWLDLELDDGLRAEGLARETVNRVNGLRKDSGLAVDERISLRLAPEDELLGRALAAHRELIAAETLATRIEFAAAAEMPASAARWDLGAGHALRGELARS
jgi:isoleucyl-tRNA synthetase